MNRQTGTGKYEALLERCRNLEPIPTLVAHPCEETALSGAVEAASKRLITPILVGPTAKIQEIAQKQNYHIVSAQAPLATMFGYATTLRSLTQGRANYHMDFSHYEEVPKAIAEQVIGTLEPAAKS